MVLYWFCIHRDSLRWVTGAIAVLGPIFADSFCLDILRWSARLHKKRQSAVSRRFSVQWQLDDIKRNIILAAP